MELAAVGHVLETWFPAAREALAAFREATGASEAPGGGEPAQEISSGARMLRAVGDDLALPGPGLTDAVDLAAVVQHAVLLGQDVARHGGGGVQARLPPDLPLIQGNRDLLRTLFELLMREMFRWQGDGANLRVEAEPGLLRDAPTIQVVFRGGTRPWDPALADLRTDLLAAFVIAHHHRGRLHILRERPVGPGFEVTLPVTPA